MCKNLKRLDVSNNSLTSLEGLHESRTLKWVSAANNQITSLRGVEGLTQLQARSLLSVLVQLRPHILQRGVLKGLYAASSVKQPGLWGGRTLPRR